MREIVVLFILFIVDVALISTLANQDADSPDSNELANSPLRIGIYQIPTLGQLIRFYNTSKEQRCQNFYASVCAPVHEIPFQVSFKNRPGYADNVISPYDLANRHIDNEIFKQLEKYQVTKGTDFHKSDIARKMFTFYDKCLDERTRAKQKGLAIKMLIERLSKLREIGSFNADMMAELFPHMPFLWFQKWIDQRIAIQLSIGIFYNAWPTPGWEEEVRTIGRQILKAIVEDATQSPELEVPSWFTALGDKTEIENRLETLIEIENRLHRDDERIEQNDIDTPEYTLGELRTEFPHGVTIDWVQLFSSLLPEQNFTDSTPVLLVKVRVNGQAERRSPLDFLKEYIRKFGSTKKDNKLKQYLEWMLILEHAALSDNKIYHRIFREHPRVSNALMSSMLVPKYFTERHANETYVKDGTPEERRTAQLGHNCLEYLKQFFPEYIDRMFAMGLDDAVEEEAKTVLDSVKSGFAQMLDQTSWLKNAKDKQKAKEKLNRMGSFIGRAPAIGNPKDPNDPELERIDDRYAPFYKYEESLPFVEIVLTLLRQWRLVDLANKAQFYGLAVHEVNGYNIYHWNSMQVTGGMLRAPFLALNQSLAQTFGAVGFIIGHELGHSFDAYGCEYNAEGIKDEKWWSKQSKDIYRKRKHCFEEQYADYQMSFEGKGLEVNGTRTVFENIADNAGIRAAYIAFKERLSQLSSKKQKKEKRKAREQLDLEEEKLDNEQMFFLSFAYSWCGHITREKMEKYLKRDTHSPREVRVNMALANFPEFAHAFHCEPGSPMNPEKRCTLWGSDEKEKNKND